MWLDGNGSSCGKWTHMIQHRTKASVKFARFKRLFAGFVRHVLCAQVVSQSFWFGAGAVYDESVLYSNRIESVGVGAEGVMHECFIESYRVGAGCKCGHFFVAQTYLEYSWDVSGVAFDKQEYFLKLSRKVLMLMEEIRKFTLCSTQKTL